MVVEDDPFTFEVLSEVLTFFGAKIILAASVAEALVALKTSKPDVMVSDIAMPGEDGYSLMRKVRQLGSDQGGDVPSIALTAYASDGNIKSALAAGFNAHIAKPLNMYQLGKAIAKLAKPS